MQPQDDELHGASRTDADQHDPVPSRTAGDPVQDDTVSGTGATLADPTMPQGDRPGAAGGDTLGGSNPQPDGAAASDTTGQPKHAGAADDTESRIGTHAGTNAASNDHTVRIDGAAVSHGASTNEGTAPGASADERAQADAQNRDSADRTAAASPASGAASATNLPTNRIGGPDGGAPPAGAATASPPDDGARRLNDGAPHGAGATAFAGSDATPATPPDERSIERKVIEGARDLVKAVLASADAGSDHRVPAVEIESLHLAQTNVPNYCQGALQRIYTLGAGSLAADAFTEGAWTVNQISVSELAAFRVALANIESMIGSLAD